MGLWLGLDIGGTNTKAVVVDDDGWHVRDRDSTPTDRSSPRRVIAGCAEFARRHVVSRTIQGMGVTLPGLFDPDKGTALLVPNIPGDWAGVQVRMPMQSTSGLPTTLLNDARAFGLAETRLGAARGYDDVVGLVLGTGVGGAIVLDGRLYQGQRGNAGELGHHVVLPGGPRCGCGNRGCLEALARADVIASESGRPTVEEAALAAAAGDARATEALATAGRWLGRGLGNILTILTPQAIVIGGGVAQAGELLLGPLRAELERSCPLVPAGSYELLGAALGTWAGAVGAAVAAADASRDGRRSRSGIAP